MDCNGPANPLVACDRSLGQHFPTGMKRQLSSSFSSSLLLFSCPKFPHLSCYHIFSSLWVSPDLRWWKDKQFSSVTTWGGEGRVHSRLLWVHSIIYGPLGTAHHPQPCWYSSSSIASKQTRGCNTQVWTHAITWGP